MLFKVDPDGIGERKSRWIWIKNAAISVILLVEKSTASCGTAFIGNDPTKPRLIRPEMICATPNCNRPIHNYSHLFEILANRGGGG